MLSFTARKRIRNKFGNVKDDVVQLPNLIEIQKNSFDTLLNPDQSKNKSIKGLGEVFKSVFPVEDFTGQATLEYVDYNFGTPKYEVEEAISRGITFSAPLRVTLRLITWQVDDEAETREIKDVKEQEVYFGEVPMMTENGTFVINGTERVIVSQMHRSPGVFFDHDRGKSHSSGKFLYTCRVIPYRGSWLDIEFDAKDLIYFRIDRRRKLSGSTLLRALGLEKQDILDTFYGKWTIKKAKKGWSKPFDIERLKGTKPTFDIIDPKSGDIIHAAGKKVTAKTVKDINKAGVSEQLVDEKGLAGMFAAEDIVDSSTGEVILNANDELSASKVLEIEEAGVKEFTVLNIDNVRVSPYIRNSVAADKTSSQDEALMEIYKVMRPGEPPTPEAGQDLFNKLFFDNERYDLSGVGRMKINARLGTDLPEDNTVLSKEDIIKTVQMLIAIKDGFEDIDDIDHLGNRRVRGVGELAENQFRSGLLRMEKAIVERMSSVELESVMPQDLVNSKALISTLREFFGQSQLSQFMDQTNPLSEITHKRRLSALGPGGLSRERAGFEVRDVHLTHYGRICPIETPEGPNIGLINSMATYSKINKYGFIETPYRIVEKSKVTDNVDYLSAIEEANAVVAQANAQLNKNGTFKEELVSARKGGEFMIVPRDEVTHMDVSPKQLVSVASSMIPFLENDDANRALMGSNMQRQAVPLLQAEAPFVGTGVEEAVARDSGLAAVTKRGGEIVQVDAERIVVKATEKDANGNTGADIYNLRKFQRSNQNTCFNQKPLVNVGQKVKAGDIIADGPSMDLGELALGRNVLCAFMPWNGYNYEDSILLSERIAKDDIFTSIHIEEFEVMARDTKLGPEEVTRDIPNVSEESLRNLDEVGIIHIGAEVRAGDILVGKVTPKSESPMTPEEKLLRAIFGEKAADVRDSSLRMPAGATGTIVDVRTFNRRGIEKDERTLAIEAEEITKLEDDKNAELAIIEGYAYEQLNELLTASKLESGLKGAKKGAEIKAQDLEGLSRKELWKIVVADTKTMDAIEKLKAQLDDGVKALNARFESKVDKVQSGDDMLPGVLKVVKVFVAVKRKMQSGDKMAGRHGNKGVVSRIVPVEDMPYLEDGTPVDMVLNPLGVPSRMNIGQIMETHLGWAAAGIGKQVREAFEKYQNDAKQADLKKVINDVYIKDEHKDAIDKMKKNELEELAGNLSNGITFATPVFDGAKEEDVADMLEKAGLDADGQSYLWDGRTGERFDRKVTVGYIYMLKLHHLVDEKIHARSIGPYSLVTQQPLGGKSHFGGQRFGEMECWALQAYGAAHTLQEMLTIKSDDVQGRTKIYESIVRGDQSFEPGVPESFNVIVKELRSLGLNVELKNSDAA